MLSWRPEEDDTTGYAGDPYSFEVQYRLTSEDTWTDSTSETYYSNVSNEEIFQYYHRVSNLVRLEDYVARVRHCDADSCSAWGSHSFRTERPIPPSPNEVRIAELGSDFFVVEWDPVPGAHSYNVYFEGGGSTESDDTNEARYETVNELTPDTRYTVTVNSCNYLKRHGEYNEEACGLLFTGTTISFATGLAELEGAAPALWPSWNGETWIVASWRPDETDSIGDSGTPDSFEVQYRLTSDSEWTDSTATTVYSNGSNHYIYQYYHQINNLLRLQDYVVQVRECDGSSCSEWATHSFRTEKPIPPAPEEIRVVELGSDYFVLEWDPVPGAYNYDVNYEGGGSRTTGGSNHERYETVFELTPGARYTVTVNSCNDLQRRGDYGEEACGFLFEGTTITVTTLE